MRLTSTVFTSTYPASLAFFGVLSATASSVTTMVVIEKINDYTKSLLMRLISPADFQPIEVKWILPYTLAACVTGAAAWILKDHFENFNKPDVEADLTLRSRIKTHLNKTISILIGSLSAALFLRIILADIPDQGNKLKYVSLHSPTGFGGFYALYLNISVIMTRLLLETEGRQELM